MKFGIFKASLLSMALLVPAAYAAIPQYEPVVIATYPHDPDAFTEGLLYQDGYLYESTGRNGQSSVRQVELKTGKVLRQHDIDRKYFGEGIVAWKDHLLELTWKDGTGFIYDTKTFKQTGEFHYEGEGWAFTSDDANIYMSDGTPDIRVLNPDTLAERKRIHVTCDGLPVRNINELEWVKGEIYANIWLTRLIVRIDPGSGKVVGIIDATGLLYKAAETRTVDVVNGIAYDAAGNRLFVTGKQWPYLFQIGLKPRKAAEGLCETVSKAAP